MSKLFNIVRLRHPGRVNSYKFGTVDLFTLPDEKLLQIYRADPHIPYLQPTEAGIKALNPNAEITIKKNPLLSRNDIADQASSIHESNRKAQASSTHKSNRKAPVSSIHESNPATKSSKPRTKKKKK